MARTLFIIAVGVIVSFALTAASGYLLYHSSGRWNEYQLSLFANRLLNPLIAVVTGFVVGTLSRTRPAVTAILALLPWAVALNYSDKLTAASFAKGLELELLTALTAAASWRLFRKNVIGASPSE